MDKKAVGNYTCLSVRNLKSDSFSYKPGARNLEKIDEKEKLTVMTVRPQIKVLKILVAATTINSK